MLNFRGSAAFRIQNPSRGGKGIKLKTPKATLVKIPLIRMSKRTNQNHASGTFASSWARESRENKDMAMPGWS